MREGKEIACVTGASGMVGRRITQRLIMDGYSVRALSRRKYFDDRRVDLFTGGLDDEDVLRQFVNGAHMLFHCAAELNNESIMWEVNVLGTEQLLRIVKESNIQYLCYLSSAGVVGRTNVKWVNEETICKPQNAYEQSKWAAEQLVAKGIAGCRVVILRPTNIIDDRQPGALSLAMDGTWMDWLKVFLKGGECAHIVHADDVASSAMFFVSHSIKTPQCFFVSCDHEPLNTFAGIWALNRAVKNGCPVDRVRPFPHLPLIVPHFLRRLWRGRSNRGDIRYSSEKLMSKGFKFPLGFIETVRQIVSANDFER